jgi:phosphatidylethanolamine/phosphatidyl-N-methylethanolamine N-methyltransferase
LKNKGFLKQFWKNKKMIGAMAPSSRFLAQKMTDNIDFAKAKVIVEMGPGTGVFTKIVMRKMNQDTKLVVFELNEVFYKRLKKGIQDDRVILIHDSAENLSDYLEQHALQKADYILSSLPLSNFEEELKTTLLHTIEGSLAAHGSFIQYQYSLDAKKMLQSIFHSVEVSFTPLNIPPAFIYTCQKK